MASPTPHPPPRRRDTDWSKLPAQFQYLRAPAEKYAVLRRDLYKGFVERASTDEIDELRAVYEEIRDRRDDAPLARWINGVKDPSEWPTAPSKRVFELYVIFWLLGDRGVSPFDRDELKCEAPDNPDWTKLPASLCYIAPAAERYGIYNDDLKIGRFVDEASPEQLRELSELSVLIRSRGDAPEIYKWFRKFRMRDHDEARLLAYLIEVMNEAGFPIEDQP